MVLPGFFIFLNKICAQVLNLFRVVSFPRVNALVFAVPRSRNRHTLWRAAQRVASGCAVLAAWSQGAGFSFLRTKLSFWADTPAIQTKPWLPHCFVVLCFSCSTRPKSLFPLAPWPRRWRELSRAVPPWPWSTEGSLLPLASNEFSLCWVA